MEMTDLPLWERIRAFELDDPGADLTFSDRLARENGWSHAFSLRAIEEYKRFMYLVRICSEPLTPSDQVDQVWHLHLVYTHSYWKEFCPNVLQAEVHHGPTLGGAQELGKFTDWYALTKQRYMEHFSTIPPPDLWPDTEKRFNAFRFQRVDRSRFWLIPKPKRTLR